MQYPYNDSLHPYLYFKARFTKYFQLLKVAPMQLLEKLPSTMIDERET